MKNLAKYLVLSGLVLSNAAFASPLQACIDKVEQAAHDQAQKDLGHDLLAIVPGSSYPTDGQVVAKRYKVDLIAPEELPVQDLVAVYWVTVDDQCNILGVSQN